MELHWTHMGEVPPRKREEIADRIRALAEERGDLLDIRIVGRTSRHHHHGDQEVRISCQARGKEIVAARSRDDLLISLDEAVDAFEREVRRMRERRTDRRSERPAPPPHLGIIDNVKRDEGYGFILTDAGEQVYFHENAVSGGLRFAELEESQRVALNLEAADAGPQATVVLPAPPDAPGP